MEEQHVVARGKLRELLQSHPDWTHGQLVAEVGYSLSWVRKWRKRLTVSSPHDETVIAGQSRRRHTPYVSVSPEVEERIVELRDHLPTTLHRVAGPKAILYYLHQEQYWADRAVELPRSTRTIWKILDRHQRIVRYRRPEHQPLERPDPMQHWQMDFKSITSVPPEPEGKKQHAVESLNILDEGTSIWIDSQVRGDFHAETVSWALSEVFAKVGLPRQLTFDRDPRFVGATNEQEFPSALHRFLLCLGIQVQICPPRRPDKNAFVERYNRSLGEECLAVHHPHTLATSQEVITNYGIFYNQDRPHQGLACRNRPPLVAFPHAVRLSALPEVVDPDRWVWKVDGQQWVRKVRANGSIGLNKTPYYVQQKLAGQYVLVRLQAATRHLQVFHRHHLLKNLPFKGLVGQLLSFQDYLPMICRQAFSEYQTYVHHRRSRFA